MKLGKKGFGIGDLAPVAIAMIVAIIAVGVGANITSNMQASTPGYINASAYGSGAGAVLGNGTAGLQQLASYFPTIGLVIAAAVVIGIVYKSFLSG